MRCSLLLFLLLGACGDKPAPAEPGTDTASGDEGDGPPDDTQVEAPTDADGDGVPEEEDCNDADPAISPLAVERCDGVDQDCDGLIDEEAEDALTYYADADGDGFSGDGLSVVACSPPDSSWSAEVTDCDDLDPDVHPEASEVCNGQDDDCDALTDDDDDSVDPFSQPPFYLDADHDGWGGETRGGFACLPPAGFDDSDEDCNDADPAIHPETWWYDDGDGDRFGDASAALQTCEPPTTTFVLDATDCDDRDRSVNPGAAEVCNDRLDDDCDGLTDDDDPNVDPGTFTNWYYDADGDAYGDPSSIQAACEPPWRYVDDASDCDDTDVSVNPDAAEVCLDGVDNDCDGGPNDCGLPSGATVASADLTLSGLSTGSSFGYSMAVDDFDGDGVLDLLAGDPSDSDGGSYAGAVFLLPGPVAASPTAAVTIGTDSYDQLGLEVASAGDLDGDGVAESLWSSPGASYTTASGLVTLAYGDPNNGSWATLYSSSSDSLGQGLAGLGDIDGDGAPDFAVGGPASDEKATNGGSIYLFTTAPRSGRTTNVSVADAAWHGASGSSSHGASGSFGAGDVDGDGLRDLAMGGYNYQGGDGTVALVYDVGAYTGDHTDNNADVTFEASASNAALGRRLQLHSDLTGDGYDDLVLVEGSYSSSRGKVWLVPGAAAGHASGFSVSASSSWSLTGAAMGDFLGRSLTTGDWNDDGVDDLALSAYSYDGFTSSGGGVFVYWGPLSSSSLTVPSADLTIEPSAASQSLSSHGLASGDVSGDGVDDLLFETAVGVGSVFVFTGGRL